jgi:uncharacterized FlgJ-related protein
MIHPRLYKKIIGDKNMREIFGMKSNITDDEDFIFDEIQTEEYKKARRIEILKIIEEYKKKIGELTQEFYELKGGWQSDDGLD